MRNVARLTWECVSCLRIAVVDVEIPPPIIHPGEVLVHVDLESLDLTCHRCGAQRVG